MLPYHVPALVHESINGLNIKPEGVYVDVTYGGGGHSGEILKKLSVGKLIAFDQDEDALKNKINDERILLLHSNFRYIKNFLKFYGIEKVDGILADLGISFHHVDELSRGFSFKSETEIDLRMNRNASIKASDILNQYDEKKLCYILREYGEIKNSYGIAKSIIETRDNSKFDKIDNLVKVLGRFAPRNAESKFFAKIFQALRIEVNKELESLQEFLKSSEILLKQGGRLVVISYHSLEDRIVKNFIRSGNFEGVHDKDIYGNFRSPFIQVNKKPIVPSEEEIKINPRSRSAKMRIAEKN